MKYVYLLCLILIHQTYSVFLRSKKVNNLDIMNPFTSPDLSNESDESLELRDANKNEIQFLEGSSNSENFDSENYFEYNPEPQNQVMGLGISYQNDDGEIAFIEENSKNKTNTITESNEEIVKNENENNNKKANEINQNTEEEESDNEDQDDEDETEHDSNPLIITNESTIESNDETNPTKETVDLVEDEDEDDITEQPYSNINTRKDNDFSSLI